VGSLSLLEGSLVGGSSFSTGRGGEVTVTATEGITISGQSEPGFLKKRIDFLDLSGSPFPPIFFSALDNLDLDPGKLRVPSGFAGSATEGNAGRIFISAPRLNIQGGLLSTGSLGRGEAGEIRLEVGKLTLGTNGLIESSASGSGRGGNITVTADSLKVIDDSIISASTSGPASGGKISINATAIDLRNSGRISSRSTSASPDAGRAGEIFIQAGDSFRLFNDSHLSAETAQANAGNLNIQVNKLLLLGADSSITTSVAGGEGNGGNITIGETLIPRFVVLDNNSQIIAKARQGSGGNIHITTDFLLADPDNIDASSEFGVSGTVEIRAPETNIIGGISVLPAAFFDASARLSERCTARIAGRLSSFVVKGRGGLPREPGDWWPSSYLDSQAVQPSFKGQGYEANPAAHGLPSNDRDSQLPSGSWEPGCGG
jgi:large exoprotein involved in heme utilization and adhesion